IAVVTRSAVRLRWIRTHAGGRVARAGVVTLIRRGPDDRVGPRTSAVLTRVGLGAGITVVARRAIRLRWIRTHAGGRVARAGVVTLIRRGAHDRVAPGADSSFPRLGLCAGIAVVTRSAVRLRWIRTH